VQVRHARWRAARRQVSVEVAAPAEAGDKKLRWSPASVSLEGLLDYSEDDTREASFEVALAAELFLEMLQTRFGRGLLRGLHVIEA
jgi:LAIKA domain